MAYDGLQSVTTKNRGKIVVESKQNLAGSWIFLSFMSTASKLSAGLEAWWCKSAKSLYYNCLAKTFILRKTFKDGYVICVTPEYLTCPVNLLSDLLGPAPCRHCPS